jgi:hypothetical protein
MISRMRANAQLTRQEALQTLVSALKFPLEIDDDGSEYLRPSLDTTLEVHVDDADPLFPLVLTVWHWKGEAEARIASKELETLIASVTGWTISASE